MSDLMNKLLADKLKARKALADLPFDEKLAIMEKIRDRSTLLAENSLRKPIVPAVPLTEGAPLETDAPKGVAGS